MTSGQTDGEISATLVPGVKERCMEKSGQVGISEEVSVEVAARDIPGLELSDQQMKSMGVAGVDEALEEMNSMEFVRVIEAEVDSDLEMRGLDVEGIEVNKSLVCKDCNEVFADSRALMDHVFDHVLKRSSFLKDSAPTEEVPTQKKSRSKVGKRNKKSIRPETSFEKNNKQESSNQKSKANPSKKTKSKKSGRNKKSKTLRESELDVNAAFVDKIEMKDDNIFHCKSCQVFVTSVKLLAKSHAQSCGTKKTVGRHGKKLSCNECGETFTGKANLIKHTRTSHVMPS